VLSGERLLKTPSRMDRPKAPKFVKKWLGAGTPGPIFFVERHFSFCVGYLLKHNSPAL
jgi:hypothetical protein